MTSLKAIEQAVCRGIKDASFDLPHDAALPPPNNLAAERNILGGLISGEISLDRFPQLKPKHFFIATHADIFEQLLIAHDINMELPIDVVVAWGMKVGISAQYLHAELVALSERPYLIPRIADESVKKIIEAHGARRLIDRMRRAIAALQTGHRTLDNAKAYLSRCVSS